MYTESSVEPCARWIVTAQASVSGMKVGGAPAHHLVLFVLVLLRVHLVDRLNAAVEAHARLERRGGAATVNHGFAAG